MIHLTVNYCLKIIQNNLETKIKILMNYNIIMSNNTNQSKKYIDLKTNGRIFPLWILKNFKKYKLPEIFYKEDEDPCNVEVKLELRKYQEFIGKYIGNSSPYNEILLYHGLGSGKTATSINLLNILYNSNNNVNTILLIKASLHDDPWMKDLSLWLERENNEEKITDPRKLKRFKNIHFVHYDSPFADKSFMETIKKVDTSKPMMFIIDEAHNFIRNVYSNINSQLGKRAQVIYEYIVREKREKKDIKVVLISATPGVNKPFELSLMFNMLRPGIFPVSETEFNRIFITDSNYPILNPNRRNLFERRILGLVSYYIGATPDLYAKQELKYINLPMSNYQYNVYRVFEQYEATVQQKAKKRRQSSNLYRTYTRQGCNFVFPQVSNKVIGELRPRPKQFQLADVIADNVEKGKLVSNDNTETVNQYMVALNSFINDTQDYFNKINATDVKNGYTIQDDLKNFQEGFIGKYNEDFVKFYKNGKSTLFKEMYNCSPKMTAIAFLSYISPGKVMIYSNYVIAEGIDLMKVYLQLIGFSDYTNAKKLFGFCEYHGRITFENRVVVKNMFNNSDNIRGEKCKIILLSPSATEGIQLRDIRQEHIMEPYWTEVRISQVIGRGIRQCSHKDLPMNERIVTVYRYKVVKPEILDTDDTEKLSTDQLVEDMAKAKDNLIQSFLFAMREAAVDCDLFKTHNMMTQSYKCFKFPETILTDKNVGPAYREDIKEDIKLDSGLHALNSISKRIRVLSIKAVYQIDDVKYSPIEKYWYHASTGIVYDYDTFFPVGRVELINNIPNKLDKDTYIIATRFDIPLINN